MVTGKEDSQSRVNMGIDCLQGKVAGRIRSSSHLQRYIECRAPHAQLVRRSCHVNIPSEMQERLHHNVLIPNAAESLIDLALGGHPQAMPSSWSIVHFSHVSSSKLFQSQTTKCSNRSRESLCQLRDYCNTVSISLVPLVDQTHDVVPRPRR